RGGRARAAQRIKLVGDPPSPINPPAGCRFAGRCPSAGPGCDQPQPLREMQRGHWVACHRVQSVAGQLQGPLQLPDAA
ncbi:MAG: peptide ABC transporter ATP-binding protein, partial [Comamonadaceae bacterium]